MQFILNTLHLQNGGGSDSEDCKCVVHQTFYGKLSSTVTCDKCRNVTTALDPYMDLSLDVRNQVKKRKLDVKSADDLQLDLRDCLERFTSRERLAAAEYTCQVCDSGQNATKQLSIKRLPPVLPIHLKVRSISWQGINLLTFNSASNTQNQHLPKLRHLFAFQCSWTYIHTPHNISRHRPKPQNCLINQTQITT